MQPYNPIQWEQSFKNLIFYKQIVSEYDMVTFEKNFLGPTYFMTPRQIIADRNRPTYFNVMPFYYIEWLQQNNPSNVYDLGCGWNIFKKYYPNIIGINPEMPGTQADIYDIVDDDYIAGHKEYFDNVFSICALHYVPLTDIKKCVTDFASMIKPSGRGWLSLNIMRMLERDKHFNNHSSAQVVEYCKQELCDLPNQVLVDIDPGQDFEFMDDGMNGNINILLEK